MPGLFPWKHVNVESTLKQHWSSTFINVVSLLIFAWLWKFSWLKFFDFVSRMTRQRWNDVDVIMPIQRRWTNVVSTLKFGWKWKLSRRMFIDVVSTLTKQCWNNVERIKPIHCWWPNVVYTLSKYPGGHLIFALAIIQRIMGTGERGAVNKNDKFQWGGHFFSTWDLSKSFQNTCLNHFHCQLRLKNPEIP